MYIFGKQNVQNDEIYDVTKYSFKVKKRSVIFVFFGSVVEVKQTIFFIA